MIYLLPLLFALFHYGRAQQTSKPQTFKFPFAVPLTVRSAYLNCWGLFAEGYGIIPTTFINAGPHSGWDPSLERLGLFVFVRVDNNTFLFLGDGVTINPGSVNIINAVLSPTRTILIAEAGPMQINLTFLNPIEPEDWVKQSIPLSYMSLTAKSLDGAAHVVQVYSDLSADWISGNRSQVVEWNWLYNEYGVTGHMVDRQNPATLTEDVFTQTRWGTLYHLMEIGDNTTWKIAEGPISRHLFLLNGVLDTPADLNTLPLYNIIPNSTVFAMSRDLGTIQATQDPIVWVVGYATDPVINYTDLSGAPPQQRRLFYKTKYPDYGSLIVDFINDFANASSRAQQRDQQILQDAAPISGLLGDLVSLATAQVYGSTLLTVATDEKGEYNKSDVMAFLKNIDGSINRANAVETLYSAFPAFMYIDPKLGGLFLEPLFQLQASQEYTNPYAAPDLGTGYPDVTVSKSTHNQGIEESGNMLIMTYAHARASGSHDLINRYYDLLTSWANYLSNSTLLIRNQYSADGLSTDNQTNLAIKGIIAIKAMSQMSSVVNRAADFDKYSSTAARLYAQWKSLALTGDNRLLAMYGQVGTWTLGYNLFADVWLNTSVVESSVYDGQSSLIDNFYSHPSSESFDPNPNGPGIPAVDNVSSVTNSDRSIIFSWFFFVAAMTSNQDLRTNLISTVYSGQFSPLIGYDGVIVQRANPAQGAIYAPLALKVPVKLTADPTTTGTSSKSHTGVVVGGTIRGVLGGIAALLVIVAVALVVWRRRRQSRRRTSVGPSSLGEVMSQGTQVTVTPFDLNPTGPTLAEVAPLLDAGPQTDWQRRFVHRPSSPGDSPDPLQRVVSVPVGLSSKELARLRSQANESRPQPMDRRPSNFPVTAVTDGGAPGGAAAVATSPSGAGIQSEVNVLRDELRDEIFDEIRRLHAEISESPPSYASGAA